jgi:sec-independent protein translocase protein TatC
MAGQFIMSFSVSLMLGFIIAFPYVFWEFWRFISPALKDNERKNARGIVFWCSLLFFAGVLFSYYIIVPYTINFFAGYQLSPEFENNIMIDNYYDTLSDLVLGMGVVFELPIVVFFLSRLGILTPQMMRKQRRYAVLILLILAEVITPPDWFSCFLVFIPLYFLYEVSIIISERAVKQRKRKLALRERA